jgi:uncharacterized protein YjaG (DUF416 family)
MDHRDRALFYAIAAERSFPLFAAFVSKHNFGNVTELREAIDFAWSKLQTHNEISGARHYLLTIEANVPPADDYRTLEALWAQDVCIVSDTAIRTAIGMEAEDAVWYCIEPLRAAVCADLIGALEYDPSDEASALAVRNDARVDHELQVLRNIVGLCEQHRVGDARAFAEAQRLSPARLLHRA